LLQHNNVNHFLYNGDIQCDTQQQRKVRAAAERAVEGGFVEILMNKIDVLQWQTNYCSCLCRPQLHRRTLEKLIKVLKQVLPPHSIGKIWYWQGSGKVKSTIKV